MTDDLRDPRGILVGAFDEVARNLDQSSPEVALIDVIIMGRPERTAKPVARKTSEESASTRHASRGGDKTKKEAGEKPSGSTRLRVKDPVRYKTVLCENFATKGACPYSYKCQFAHGEDELRTKEAGEKRRGRSTSTTPASSGQTTPLCSPTTKTGRPRQQPHSLSHGASPDASGFPHVSCDRTPSPLQLPRPHLAPVWGPRDKELFRDLRESSPPSIAGARFGPATSPRAAPQPIQPLRKQPPPALQISLPPLPPGLSVPLTPTFGQLPCALPLGSPQPSASSPQQLSPFAHSTVSPLLVSPLLHAAPAPTVRWQLVEPPQAESVEAEFDADAALFCNPVTGEVEILPMPPHVLAREASHNTMSVRRSISLLWNDDEPDLTEEERESALAAKMWEWSQNQAELDAGGSAANTHANTLANTAAKTLAKAPSASSAGPISPVSVSATLPIRATPPQSSSGRSSYSSAFESSLEDEPCDEHSSYRAASPALAEQPGLTSEAWLKNLQSRNTMSQGAENVARQFDYLFRDVGAGRVVAT